MTTPKDDEFMEKAARNLTAAAVESLRVTGGDYLALHEAIATALRTAVQEAVEREREAIAIWHDEQERIRRARAVEVAAMEMVPQDVVHAHDQYADWHRDSAAFIR